METARGMGLHGACENIIALLLFDPMGGGHTQQALLRWTGVYPTHAEQKDLEDTFGGKVCLGCAYKRVAQVCYCSGSP